MWTVRIVVHDGNDIIDILEIDREAKDEVDMMRAAKIYVHSFMSQHHPDEKSYQVTYEHLRRK